MTSDLSPTTGTLAAVGGRGTVGAVARPELKVAHEEEAQAQQSVVTHRLPPLEVARASLVVLGVLISAYLLWRVRDVLFLLMLAILLATAIEPIVHRLRRGPFTRGIGVLVVYTAIVLAIGVPAYTIAPSVASQSVAFINDMPDRLERLRPYALDLQPRQVATAAVAGIDRLIDAVRSPAAPPQEQIVAAGETAAHTLVSFLTVFVLAFYWIVERAQIKSALLRAVRPERRRDVNSVWFEVEEKLGGWVRGQLILMLAIGLMAGIGYTVIGLPSPIPLAVAAGLFEVVPMIGPFLAFAPAVLVGLAIDPTRALIVAGYALIIQVDVRKHWRGYRCFPFLQDKLPTI